MTRWKMHRRVLLLFLGMAVPNFIVIWSRLNCFTASYYSDPLSGSHILGIDHLYTHMVTSWWMKLAIDYATRIWMHRDRWRMMIWSLSFVIFAYGHLAESKRVAQSLESAPHKNKKKKTYWRSFRRVNTIAFAAGSLLGSLFTSLNGLFHARLVTDCTPLSSLLLCGCVGLRESSWLGAPLWEWRHRPRTSPLIRWAR